MSTHLSHNLTSSYIEAANRLDGKNARQRIIAYVEGFDDILFWSNLLHSVPSGRFDFEVMLPSRTSLSKGKKIALANRLGPRMIACVDADYDYLLQGATEVSRTVCENPYVFHTYVYAIENFQLYAPTLQKVCVTAMLNDRRVFDFEAFLRTFSEVVWPLFVWSIWAYRYGRYKTFSLTDFAGVIAMNDVSVARPDQALERLRHRVNAKIARLQRQFPEGRKTYKPLMEQLMALGLTPDTTYLYIRGHDLHDGVLSSLLNTVCDILRREREREIRRLAGHNLQMHNEMASYQHAVAPVDEVLRKHTAYVGAPLYQRIQSDITRHLQQLEQQMEKQP